jgi:membrane-associated phospholipid phosphatase
MSSSIASCAGGVPHSPVPLVDAAPTLGAVPAVALSRIYVGAHLPLDIAGGAALGLVIDAAITLVIDGTARPVRAETIHAPLPSRHPQRRTPNRDP